MLSIKVKFLPAGIVIPFAHLSFLALIVGGCSLPGKNASRDLESQKLQVIARCIRTLADTMDNKTEIRISLYRSTEDPAVVTPPKSFLSEIKRDQVRLASESSGTLVGISHVAIYLNRIDIVPEGERVISFNEVHSLSQKYIHEFEVKYHDGNLQKVSLLRTTEI